LRLKTPPDRPTAFNPARSDDQSGGEE